MSIIIAEAEEVSTNIFMAVVSKLDNSKHRLWSICETHPSPPVNKSDRPRYNFVENEFHVS